jgi:hypothetical protein
VAPRRSNRVGAGAVLVIVLIFAGLALSKLKHAHYPHPAGSGCIVRGANFDVPLSLDQAGLAATIAGVAKHASMPPKAVTIAYATALQESKLQNLRYGDRDSVGIFQQRPSQGWGTRQELLDPVYASARFFAALRAVPGYQNLQVYQAAQDVQHSADGYAYSQWAPQGAVMASAFSGQSPHSVWCWYGRKVTGKRRLADASQQLARAFGRLRIGHTGDPVARVQVRHPAFGWAIASWLVSHAGNLRIRYVRYDGYQWTAALARKGWLKLPSPGQHSAGQHTGGLHTGDKQAGGTQRGRGQVPAGPRAVVFG